MEQLQSLIRALEQPSAYPHPVSAVKTIITAVSVVFLMGQYAYKINKPLNLGFLDFSTLDKRKDQCEKELKYNSLISPDIYVAVLPITRKNEKITVGGDGEVIEYALKMKQMDPDATMNRLLLKNQVTLGDILQLAKKIFAFHQKASTGPEIAQFGTVASIRRNWDDLFSKTKHHIPRLVSATDYNFIARKVYGFMDREEQLFEKRVNENRIKFCHGDFHSENVFMTPEGVFIFDRIVFNKQFPSSDVVAEIAFMAMDLEFHDRNDLSCVFIDEYEKLSQDTELRTLLPFYLCFRAYIRAWVNSFTAEDTNLNPKGKEKAEEKAIKYFSLATSYAKRL